MGKLGRRGLQTRTRGRKMKVSFARTTIMDLPEHLLMIIFSKCHPETLLQASVVCKHFHGLCTSDTLWMPLLNDIHWRVYVSYFILEKICDPRALQRIVFTCYDSDGAHTHVLWRLLAPGHALGTRRRKMKVSSERTTIMDLPEEELMIIFSKCHPQTLLQASAVCKHFHALCTSDTLWVPLLDDIHWGVLLGCLILEKMCDLRRDLKWSFACICDDSGGADTHVLWRLLAPGYPLVNLAKFSEILEIFKLRVGQKYKLEMSCKSGLRISQWHVTLPERQLSIDVVPSECEESLRLRREMIAAEAMLNSRSSKQSGGRVPLPRRKEHRERELVDAGHIAKVRRLRNPWLTLGQRKR